MRDPLGLVLLILAMAAATQATRFLPFLLPSRWLDNAFVRTLRTGLPAVILLLLVVYCLKDVAWTSSPWGLAELLSLATVVVLHLWKRNALISIGVGTALYMVLEQTGLFEQLASLWIGR